MLAIAADSSQNFASPKVCMVLSLQSLTSEMIRVDVASLLFLFIMS